MLFELPNDITTRLLGEFLCISELCAIDTAICQRSLRLTWLYTSFDKLLLRKAVHGMICNQAWIPWILARKLTVESFDTSFIGLGTNIEQHVVAWKDYCECSGNWIRELKVLDSTKIWQKAEEASSFRL